MISHNYATRQRTAKTVYSVRQLYSQISGYCLRVRRASDNAEQDVGFSGGALDTVSLSAFCGASAGYLSVWYDQTGYGLDMSQTNTSLQPMIYDGSVVLTADNGKPALKFDGDYIFVPNSRGDFTYLHNGTSSSVFMVVSPGLVSNPNAGYSLIMNNGGASYNIGASLGYEDRSVYGFNDTLSVGVTNGITSQPSIDNRPNNVITPNVSHIVSVFIDAGAAVAADRVTGYVDNVNAGFANTHTRAPSLAMSTNFMQIGTLSGYLQELVFYNSDKSADRSAIEADMNGYYGIY